MNTREVYKFLIFTLLYKLIDGKLVKRIVGGDRVRKRDPSLMPYNAVQYFVWIGNGHTCDESPSWWDRIGGAIFSKRCSPRPDNVLCSGALITPQIVQTACHCISDFDTTGVYLWNRARIWIPPEHKCEIYMGLNTVSDFEFILLPEWFMVHQKCAKLSLAQAYVSYDYGWIYLNFKIQDSFVIYQNYFMDYAPLYTLEKLNQIAEDSVNKESVCLTIGFGLKSLVSGERKATNTMRHAWIILFDKGTCRHWTVTWRNISGRFDYDTYDSWACAVPFNHLVGGYHAHGDSGGPITCNNNYFAVVSGHWSLQRRRNDVSVLLREDPIKHAEKENAAEYRRAFMEEMDDYEWVTGLRDELRRMHPNGVINLFRENPLFSKTNIYHSRALKKSLNKPMALIVSDAQTTTYRYSIILACCILSLTIFIHFQHT